MNSFGSKLKACREDVKLSQAQMANFLGVSQARIGAYERGEALPAVESIQTMARIVQTTVEYLMKEQNPESQLKRSVLAATITESTFRYQFEKEESAYSIDRLLASIQTECVYK